MSLKEKLSKSNKTRQFLHFDIQQTRYIKQFTRRPVMLRYLNDSGVLVQQRFIVYVGYTHIKILEAKNSYPKEVKGPKGPLTLKTARHRDSQYYALGLRHRKVWWISHKSVL